MIFIGCDHAGFDLKEKVKKHLKKNRVAYKDLSLIFNPSDDYPDVAKRVAKNVKKTKQNKGILICGAGIGMCIAANRFKGIRAAAVYDKYSTEMSRQHNNANLICLRARKFPARKALNLIEIFLKTKFSSIDRHIRRINRLDKI